MGLKRLISKLDSGEGSYGDTYPNHNTPSNAGGFNYGESLSIFDANKSNNSYFPFRQRSMGYGPQGIKDNTGIFGRIHGPAPYRKQNLPDLDPTKLGPGDTGPILGVGGVIDSITDVGVRGGLVTAVKRSAIDALRIGEFMLSAKGLGFIAKNVGLQMTNPKLQEGKGSKFLGMNLGSNNRIYNLGVNTLAQTLTAASGLHINRAGLLPIGAKNYEVEPGYRVDSLNKTKYEYNVRGVDPETEGGSGNKTNGIDVYKSNRLTALYNNLLNPRQLKELGESGTFGDEFSGADFNGNPMHAPNLYSFRGGPHSIYGIGKTSLKRYVFTNRDVNKAQLDIVQQREGYKISRHIGSLQGPKGLTSLTSIIDFRKNRGIPYTNYNQKLGDTGKQLTELYGYSRGVVRPSIPTNDDGTINIRSSHPLADKINSTDIWTHTGPWDTTDLGSKVKDFIKFRIEAVNTDKPTESDTMVFRAFLDSFSDSYSSKWNEYNYNGRAEPFFTYGGFNRSISFDFKVAAFSRDDMRPMYRKLNYLVSQTAGDYKNTRLRGNFCRLTIGDYHSRLPGFFTSINLKWNKDYPWEIALNQGGVGTKAKVSGDSHTSSPEIKPTWHEQYLLDAAKDRKKTKLEAEGNANNESTTTTDNINGSSDTHDMDSDMLELPHVLDVSCTFQPVHDFIPQKSVKSSPFILPTKYSKNSMTDEQDWLQWDPISQDKRKADLNTIKEEEKKQADEFKAYEKAEEDRIAKEEAARQAEIDKEWEDQVKADEEWMENNPIEEEDSPEPWDTQPPIDPGNSPNPDDEINIPGAGGGYSGGF
tara:strand:+ start:499 stop:2934 length:2436 start_codon:yes stop_codon:yes gene_type:complete